MFASASPTATRRRFWIFDHKTISILRSPKICNSQWRQTILLSCIASFILQKPVRLTKNEFDLLAVLIRHAGQVLTNGQLLQEVWGDSSRAHATYVRVYMRSLRKKLEAAPTRPRLLLTELGIGYRLKPDK